MDPITWIFAVLVSGLAADKANIYMHLSCGVPEEFSREMEDKAYEFCYVADELAKEVA
jgi:hypothetical protein